jgi:hypothetical protein
MFRSIETPKIPKYHSSPPLSVEAENQYLLTRLTTHIKIRRVDLQLQLAMFHHRHTSLPSQIVLA